MSQLIRVLRTQKMGDKIVQSSSYEFGNPAEAIDLLITEVRAGGIIVPPSTDSRHHKILVRTQSEDGSIEESVYRGPDAMMHSLHDFLFFNNQYNGTKTVEVDGIEQLVDPRMAYVHPEVESLFKGPLRTKAAMAIACGVHDPDHINVLVKQPKKEMAAFIGLKQAGDCQQPQEIFTS